MAIKNEPANVASMSHAWRALKHRNFQLFVAGQSVSLIGTWMTRLATTWLVYELTHSALMLGLVSFAGNIVTFALAPFGGVWVERLPRRQLLICTQIAAAIQSLLLAVLTLTHVINIPEVIALTALQGLINALDMPGRQSFMVQMASREDLSNAIAINSSMVNGARLIGPAIAGAIIAWVGTGYCFLIDGLSYIAVIISLTLMQINATAVKRSAMTMFEQMREGWDYVHGFRPIRSILMLFALVALMGYPYGVLLPIFATKVLHGNATTLGWLTGATGAGAFISAVSLAARKSVLGLGRQLQIAAGIFGAALMLFGFSNNLWTSLLFMLMAGFGMTQCMAICNTLIQTMVQEDKRARVMSYYTMTFFATMPLGSLLAGFVAQHIGAPHTVMITGAFCICGSIWFALELPKVREAARPVYKELGLIPEQQPITEA